MSYQNRRIFYATQWAGVAPLGTTNFINTHGLQSFGINTNFTLENIQEIGQIEIYQMIEQIPEIEVNAEKVIDGYPLLYHLATQGGASASLVGRSNQRCMFAASIYGDVQSSASGTPLSQVTCSGLYWSSVQFALGTDGALKESLTLVGNDIQWVNSGYTFTPTSNNADSPLALAGSGGIQIRRDIIFYPVLGAGDPNYAKETASTLDANGQLQAFLTILPTNIAGISSSGTNDRDSNGNFSVHITSINCGVQANRDAILELGRKEPYFRFINFPVEVTSDYTIISKLGTMINASELGYDGLGNNLTNQSARIRLREGTWIDMGTKNKLRSANYGGGDTGGGQVNCTYSFVTYNDFTVTHPQDPSGFAWPY